jgi:oligopeptide/dipeptide ABC transporter ATP-binding protein
MPQTGQPGEALYVIPGQVPNPRSWPSGCRFHPRCAYAVEACRTAPVPLERAPDGEQVDASAHEVRCVRADELVLRGAE